jgi:hypothetical protein
MTYNYGSPITGTLTGATAIVSTPASAIQYPATVVFNSTTTPTIQFSLDGTNYYPAVTPTGTITGQIYYVLNFPVAKIKFTGAANDTYAIL